MSVNMKAAKKANDNVAWEIIKIVIQAIAIAVLIRAFLIQPFNIPTGSMKKTLLVGDYLFVSKLSYGYSRYSFHDIIPFSGRIFGWEPRRGDVAVFKLPRDDSKDYIKRIIGLPGDVIEMRGGVLHINGTAVPKVRTGDFSTFENGSFVEDIAVFRETLPNGVSYSVLDSDPDGGFDNAGPYTVPDGKYFMMGDNRDNSTDSRALYDVGYVPRDNLVGRAQVIFFSAATDDPSVHFFQPWTWDFRWNRFFNLVR